MMMKKRIKTVSVIAAAVFIVTTALSFCTWGTLHGYHWSFPWLTVCRGGPKDTVAIEDFRLWFLLIHIGVSFLIAWGLVAAAVWLRKLGNKKSPNQTSQSATSEPAPGTDSSAHEG